MEFYSNSNENSITLLNDEESNKSANILKLVFIMVILAVTLFFGFWPLFW